MNTEDRRTEQGQCWACPYYQDYGNYCDYYNIVLNGNGYEPTCRNKELKTNNDKIQ